MGDKNVGLISKYEVRRVDAKPVGWCFVLEFKDPLAIPALEAYSVAARDAGYEPLADDLDVKLETMRNIHAEGHQHQCGKPEECPGGKTAIKV
jgi:hypothetical protein